MVLIVLSLVTGLVAGCSAFGSTQQPSPPTSESPVSSVTSGTAPSTSSTTTTTLSAAQTILGRMTLREKAAQVLLLAFDGTTILPETRQLMADAPPGGFLLLTRNVMGVDQLRSLTAALQVDAAVSGAGIGLFIAVDQEGGTVRRVTVGVPFVPSARMIGEQMSSAEAARLAAETATGLLGLGVNMNLAPVADVVSDLKSFLYRRTFSGDPTIVCRYVGAITRSYEENGLVAVVKHFPGHGSAAGDSHSSVVVSKAGQAEFATVHLPPFKAAMAAGVEGVLMAHVIANAYDPQSPASSSAAIIQDLLREGLGFSGLVVADDVEMVAATGGAGIDPSEVAVRELAAGCDLLISTGTVAQQKAMLEAIVQAVETGRLPAERLDDAVLRVLETKLRHRLVSP